MKKNTWLIGVMACSLVSFSPFTMSAPPKKPMQAAAIAVGVQSVGQYDVQQSLTLVSKLEAQQSVLIKPEVSGKVEQIHVQSNQTVKAGQPLVSLDVNKAKATLNEAKAYLNDEQRKEREYARLVKKNAITQTELDAQRASVDIAKARLDAALADLSYLNIKAPFSGTIGFVDFSKGKMVSVGEELFTLDNLENMRLDLQIPEKYLYAISTGMKVKTISRAWEGQQFEGTVTHINTRVNESTLSVPIRIDIPNRDSKLKPGMLMSATLAFPAEHKPIIPVQALEYAGTKRFVYVIKDNKAVRTEIILGTRIEDKIVVESGINIDDVIVTKGLVNMRDGVAVKIIEQETLELPESSQDEVK